jgi:hypothetical protein
MFKAYSLLLLFFSATLSTDEGIAEFSVDVGGSAQRDYSHAGAHALQGDFFLASMAGDVPEVRSMLSQGAHLEGEDALGRTALHLAAINARAELVAELLSLGAAHRAADRAGRTPLDSAQVLLGEAEEEGDAHKFHHLERVVRALRNAEKLGLGKS